MTLIWEPSNDDFSLLSLATQVLKHVMIVSCHGGALLCHENMPRFEFFYEHLIIFRSDWIHFFTFFLFRAFFESLLFFDVDDDAHGNMV